jgi:hypothetical protein
MKRQKEILLVHSSQVEGKWLFPNIGSMTAWQVSKKMLGQEFYPHYFRLRKPSKIGINREKGIITSESRLRNQKSEGARRCHMSIQNTELYINIEHTLFDSGSDNFCRDS